MNNEKYPKNAIKWVGTQPLWVTATVIAWEDDMIHKIKGIFREKQKESFCEAVATLAYYLHFIYFCITVKRLLLNEI
jgi:hypothetical protein